MPDLDLRRGPSHQFRLAVLFAVLLFAAFLESQAVRAADTKDALPNIVFIMADDLGYGDPQCYNPESKIPTPQIDRLAKEGIRFTDAHAPAALCVPTRFSLLTGRYPFRATNSLVPYRGLTLQGMLQQQGYHTACIGKWHLGIHVPDNDYSQQLRGGPVDRGFDRYFGIPASLDIPPYYYIENDRAVQPPTETIEANYSEGWTKIQGAFWRDGKIAPDFKHDEVLPTLSDAANAYLEDRADSDQPFFLYVPLTGPHTPWLPLKQFDGKSEAAMYGDFVVQVDAVVGRLLDTLDRLKLADNTLVLFTSDNGPVWYDEDEERYGHRSVGSLRGMKADAWEGGHRMPFLARWPGKVPAGKVSDELICHVDMLATFAGLTGFELPSNEGPDSHDIRRALSGKPLESPIREALVTTHLSNTKTIRQGRWKLITALGSSGFSKPRSVKPEPGGPQGQLYDLEADLGETDNLWSEHPEIVDRLTTLLKQYEDTGRSTPNELDK